MGAYTFQMVIGDAGAITPEIESAVFEMFEGDVAVSSSGGAVSLDFTEFDLEEVSERSLFDLVARVEAGLGGLRVVRIEPDGLASAAEIAARSGLSREAIRLFAKGERGNGMFPEPARISGRLHLWRWNDVLNWFMEYYAPDHPTVERLTTEYRGFMIPLAAVSGVLMARTSPTAIQAAIASGVLDPTDSVEITTR